MDSWSDRTTAALAALGHRRGGARTAVIGLLDEQHCCVSAQQIADQLSERGSPVGVASIYRVLELLEEHDLVQRVDTGDGIARYEPRRSQHHHHLVCADCGRVTPFQDAGLEQAIHQLEGQLGVRVQTHEVLLRGQCDTCLHPPR